MSEKKTAKNLILNVARVGLNLLFPLVTFPYISKILGPESLGKVNFTSSVINYFVLIASMGIPSYGVIVCAKSKDDKDKLKKTICELLYINIALVVIAYILFVGSLLLIPKFQVDLKLFLIQSVSIVLTASGVDWLYSALEDFAYITIRSIGFKIISMAMMFLLVKTNEDYLMYAVILILSSAGSCVLNLIHARDYIRFYKLDALDMKRHVKPILTFFAASVAATISSNLDTTMLGFIKGDYEVGLYSFAVKIKNLLVMVDSAILAVFIPKFSVYVQKKAYDQFRKNARILAEVLYVFACLIACFAVEFSGDIILILGGSAYLNSEAALKILTSCLIVLSMTWVLGVGMLQPLGMEKEYAKGITISSIVNIAFNAILIPYLGATGAAIATFVSEGTQLILYRRYLKAFLGNMFAHVHWGRILSSCGVAAGVTLFFLQKVNASALVRLIISLLTYSLMASALILLTNAEPRGWLQAMIKKIMRETKQ